MRNMCLGLFLVSAIMAAGLHTAKADPPLNGEMSRFNFSAGQEELSRVSLTDADDNEVSLSRFRGKIVLLNVWATWCGPCVMELPKLDHLQATLGGNDFIVVPVSIDRGGAHQAQPFLTRMNISAVTPYFDRSNSIGRLLSASRVPVTVIIGRDGNEIGRFIGTADWDSDEARALVKYFIASNGQTGHQPAVTSDQVSMSR